MHDELDEHLDAVVESLMDGEVVPFLGAGVNITGEKWDDASPARLPSGDELTQFLVKKGRYPRTDGDLARVAQYVAMSRDRSELNKHLHGVFRRTYAPAPIHHLLADLGDLRRALGHDDPLLVVTTNYDLLSEQAFEARGIPLDVVYYDASPGAGFRHGIFRHVTPAGAVIDVESGNNYFVHAKGAVLMKIHGTHFRVQDESRPIKSEQWERDRYLITEDDYIRFLAQQPLESAVPTNLLRCLRNKRLLFLGYSLRDWNLRVFLRRIEGGNVLGRKSWAVVRPVGDAQDSAADRKLLAMEKEYWQAHKITFVEVLLDEYVMLLRERLRQALARLSTSNTPSGAGVDVAGF